MTRSSICTGVGGCVPYGLFIALAIGCSDSSLTTRPGANVGHSVTPSDPADLSLNERSRNDILDPASNDPLTIAERRQANGDLEGALRVLRDANQPTSPLDLKGRLQLVRLNQAVAFRRADSQDNESARAEFLTTGRLAKAIVADFPRLSPGDSETVALALYNAACSSAFLNQPADALEFLELAIDFGFANFDELEHDADLDSIRTFESFQAIRDRLCVVRRTRIEATIRQRAAELPRFDFEFEGRDLEGRQIRSAEYRGHPLVVLFWMTGFPACQEQARNLVELRRRFAEHSLAVVGLSYDRFAVDDDQDQLVAETRRVAASLRIDFPCLTGDESTKKRIPNFVGYPSLLFLDRDGTPRLLFSELEDLSTLEVAVEWLLDQATEP